MDDTEYAQSATRRGRLRGLLLLIEHEERMKELEQDKSFQESVKRCTAWAIKHLSRFKTPSSG